MDSDKLFGQLISKEESVMLPAEWGVFSFSDSLRVVEGRSGMEAALQEQVSEDLPALLDDEGLEALRTMISAPGRDRPSASVVRTRSGKTLEIMLAGSAPGPLFTAFYRDIQGFVRSVERLAIFYKNYLHTPIAICFTDASGNIIEANRSFLDLYGYELSEIRGNNPKILKSGRQSPLAYKSLWESITDKKNGSWTGELINRKKNGEEIYVLLTISSVFRPDGSLIGYVASTLDISKRKKMELELEARNMELENLNRFKSDMMAITSHDLKAPLNAMISYADLLLENLGSMPGAKMSDYLSKISEYGHHLTKFIGELLDLTRIEAGRFQLLTNRTRLDSVLQGCIEINQAHSMGKGVRIRFCREGENRTAVVDVMRMAQVFNNILSNAVKFSPDNGEITVVYRDGGGRNVRITIDDQGSGIPEKELNAIFDQYYQVQAAGHAAKRAFGAGIGLSVVKSIVELHGGNVRVENLTGKGCRFTIDMPLKTFTSVKGLAAMCYDPGREIFGYIEGPARSIGMDFFTALTMTEMKRIIEYDNPDLIFVSAAALSAEALSFLKTKMGDSGRFHIVNVQDEEPLETSGGGLFFRTLSTPLTDVEVNALFREIFEAMQKGV